MFLGTFNVFRKYKLLKFECFMLILPLNPSPHRSQWCGFSPVLLLKVSLATENTLIWILSRKTIHATLCVVPGNKSFVTDNPIIQILPSQTFMCLFRWFFILISCQSLKLKLSLQEVPGDAVLPTESTGMIIVPSMTVNMSLYVVLSYEHLPHRAQ